MKRFFYASAAVLMLSLAFHFGYTTARAQVGGTIVGTVQSCGGLLVVTSNGDMFSAPNSSCPENFGPPVFKGNFWAGGATPALHESWGQLKSRYTPKSAPTSQPPTASK